MLELAGFLLYASQLSLQIMHQILKLVVLPSDTVLNPLLIRSS
jgi:hypothetical protein